MNIPHKNKKSLNILVYGNIPITNKDIYSSFNAAKLLTVSSSKILFKELTHETYDILLFDYDILSINGEQNLLEKINLVHPWIILIPIVDSEYNIKTSISYKFLLIKKDNIKETLKNTSKKVNNELKKNHIPSFSYDLFLKLQNSTINIFEEGKKQALYDAIITVLQTYFSDISLAFINLHNTRDTVLLNIPNEESDKFSESIRQSYELEFSSIQNVSPIIDAVLKENIENKNFKLLYFLPELRCTTSNIVFTVFETNNSSYKDSNSFLILLKYIHKIITVIKKHHSDKYIDTLTNAYSYQYLHNLFQYYISYDQKEYQPFNIIMLNIDDFKEYNRGYGIEAASQLLKEIADFLIEVSGPDKIVSRLFADEFIILFNENDKTDVVDFSKEIMDKIYKNSIKVMEIPIYLKLSISIFSSNDFQAKDLNQILEFAHKALELAKNNGGNQIVNCTEVFTALNKKESLKTRNALTDEKQKSNVLIIDDELVTLTLFERVVKNCGFNVTTCNNPIDAQKIIKSNHDSIDIIITDINMPKMNGFELVKYIQSVDKNIISIITTAEDSVNNVIKILRIGAFNFIRKPPKQEEVSEILNRAVARRKLKLKLSNFNRLLKKELKDKTHALNFALLQLRSSYLKTMEVIVNILDKHENKTADHSRKVSKLATILAQEMGINDQEELKSIESGALLHDIGKIGISDLIINKNGKLNSAEKTIMKTHSQLGYEIISTIPILKNAAEMIYSHHERFDGNGYPRQLKGNDIIITARIFAVADSFDAIRSDRPYRKGSSLTEAVKEINLNSGTQFDPEVVSAFNRCYIKLNKFYQ